MAQASPRLPDDPHNLTVQQRLFVQEYVARNNGRQAAIAAGYSVRSAYSTAGHLLGYPNVKQAIADERLALANRARFSQDQIAQELGRLGFSNILDYMRIGADGQPYLDFSEMSREQAAAVQELVVDEYQDGRGEDARGVKRVKFKLYDKKGALVDLAKLLGYWKERGELSGPDGGPLQLEEVGAARSRVVERLAALGARLTFEQATRITVEPASRGNGKGNGGARG